MWAYCLQRETSQRQTQRLRPGRGGGWVEAHEPGLCAAPVNLQHPRSTDDRPTAEWVSQPMPLAGRSLPNTPSSLPLADTSLVDNFPDFRSSLLEEAAGVPCNAWGAGYRPSPDLSTRGERMYPKCLSFTPRGQVSFPDFIGSGIVAALQQIAQGQGYGQVPSKGPDMPLCALSNKSKFRKLATPSQAAAGAKLARPAKRA